MAAPTGKGCSPTIRVRVPREVEVALRAVAAMQKSTISALAREAVCACFEGLLDDAAISTELERRKAALGHGEDVEA
jgi:hypothetical protein